MDGGDGFYYFFVQGNDHFAGSIAANPYVTVTFKCAYADIENNNWVLVGQSPALIPSSYAEEVLDISCVVNFSGTYHAWFSTRTTATTGTAWTSGHGTFASTLASAISVDGLGPNDASAINNNSGTGSRPENPKVWFSTPLNAWLKAVNCVDSGGSATTANDLYIVPGSAGSVPTWTGSNSYRFRSLPGTFTTPFGAFLPIGIWSPFCDLSGAVLQETDGSLGFVIDANITNSDAHLDRDFYQGQLEASANALAIDDPSPGQSTTAYYVTTPTAVITDCEIEFVLSYGPSNTTTNSDIAVLYRHNGGDDSTGHGYVLNFSGEAASPSIALYRQNTGFSSFQLIGSANTPPVFTRDLDSRNFQIHQVKVRVVGNVHTCWVDGVQMFSLTDDGTNGGVVASGDHIGFRAVGAVGKIRALHFRTGGTIMVSGCPAGATAVLRGANKTIWDVQTADGSGNVTLSSYHFPGYSIEIAGMNYTPSGGSGDSALFWGGDQFNLAGSEVLWARSSM